MGVAVIGYCYRLADYLYQRRYLNTRYITCSPIPASINRTPITPAPTSSAPEHENTVRARPPTMQIAGTLFAIALKSKLTDGILTDVVPKRKAKIALYRVESQLERAFNEKIREVSK